MRVVNTFIGLCLAIAAPAALGAVSSHGMTASSFNLGVLERELCPCLKNSLGLKLPFKHLPPRDVSFVLEVMQYYNITLEDVPCVACPECANKLTCEKFGERFASPQVSHIVNKGLEMFEACQEQLGSADLFTKKVNGTGTVCDCCLRDSPEQVAVFPTDERNAIYITWVQRSYNPKFANVLWKIKGRSTVVNGVVVKPHPWYSGDPLPIDLNCHLCGGKNNYKGFFYRVKLTDIPYHTPFTYQVGVDPENIVEIPVNTHSMTLKNHKHCNTRVAVIGDSGTYGARYTYQTLSGLVHKLDALVSLGDLSYNNGYASIYDDFFRVLEAAKISTQLPLINMAGNHENVWDYAAFNDRFIQPNSSIKTSRHGRSFYKLRNGNIHFISLNFELKTVDPIWQVPSLGSAPLFESEFKWLKHTLATIASQRKAGEWIVVMSHRPMYCSTANCGFLSQLIGRKDCTNHLTSACGNEAKAIREATYGPEKKTIEDLFVDYEVDIYFGAHIHNYERTHPIFKGDFLTTNVTSNLCAFGKGREDRPFCIPEVPVYKNPKYPVHILNGAGGTAIEQSDIMYVSPSPAWSASRIVADACVTVAGINACQNPKEIGGLGFLNGNMTHLTWSFFGSYEPQAFTDGFVITRD